MPLRLPFPRPSLSDLKTSLFCDHIYTQWCITEHFYVMLASSANSGMTKATSCESQTKLRELREGLLRPK